MSCWSAGFPLGGTLLGTVLGHDAAVVGLGPVLVHRLSDVDHDVGLDVGGPACQLGSGVLGLLAQIGGVGPPGDTTEAVTGSTDHRTTY